MYSSICGNVLYNIKFVNNNIDYSSNKAFENIVSGLVSSLVPTYANKLLQYV
jgi:hypothetical protein